MEAALGEVQPSPVLGTLDSGVLPEHPGALQEVGWKPAVPLAQPPVADVLFERKQGLPGLPH